METQTQEENMARTTMFLIKRTITFADNTTHEDDLGVAETQLAAEIYARKAVKARHRVGVTFIPSGWGKSTTGPFTGFMVNNTTVEIRVDVVPVPRVTSRTVG
jgi:hypothetical protein